MKNISFDIHKAWRIPAILSFIGAIALLASPGLHVFPSGTTGRQLVATILAFGICSTLLGCGLGLWIAIRSRRFPAILAAVFATAVGILWWKLVFGPILIGLK